MDFVSKSIKVDGKKTSFWENEISNPRKNILFLAPGSDTGKFFASLLGELNILNQFRFISVDYPGRGNSEPIETTYKLDQLVNHLKDFCIELNLDRYIIVGASFGTAVANNLIRLDQEKVEQAVLIAPGEFFPRYKAKIYKFISYPSKYSEKIRILYRNLIIKYGTEFRSLPENNLLSYLDNWFAALDYSLSKLQPVQTQTTLIRMKKDEIISYKSYEKIKLLYPHHQEYIIDDMHRGIAKAFSDIFPSILDRIDKDTTQTVI